MNFITDIGLSQSTGFSLELLLDCSFCVMSLLYYINIIVDLQKAFHRSLLNIAYDVSSTQMTSGNNLCKVFVPTMFWSHTQQTSWSTWNVCMKNISTVFCTESQKLMLKTSCYLYWNNVGNYGQVSLLGVFSWYSLQLELRWPFLLNISVFCPHRAMIKTIFWNVEPCYLSSRQMCVENNSLASLCTFTKISWLPVPVVFINSLPHVDMGPKGPSMLDNIEKFVFSYYKESKHAMVLWFWRH